MDRKTSLDRTRSLGQGQQWQDAIWNWLTKPVQNSVQESSSNDHDVHGEELQSNQMEQWEGLSGSSYQSFDLEREKMLGNLDSMSMPEDEESEEESARSNSSYESEGDPQASYASDDLEDDLTSEDELFNQLQKAKEEIEKLNQELYEERSRRQKAEKNALDTVQRAKALGNPCVEEMKGKGETEETVASLKLELKNLKSERVQALENFRKVKEQRSSFETQVANSESLLKDFEKKLRTSQHLTQSFQREREELQQERNMAVQQLTEMCQRKKEMEKIAHASANFSMFSSLELNQATNNFDSSLKIREGGYGSVYKGSLRHTTVAIKILDPQSMQGSTEFCQEVDILSKVRHPNLVTLIGTCPESLSLIYEFLPNGSLEDRLNQMKKFLPLSWRIRTRIATEVCTALIFLHSNKPNRIVHGDLKPANILLDANFQSKLCDFGICRLLPPPNSNTTIYHRTNPKGTDLYMDPEFLSTGKLTPSSDVYSFGIIILRLLTGRPPAFRIVKEVGEAIKNGRLHRILDASAGEWPLDQAQQLANLGLRCCQMNRRSRPDLVEDVMRVLEPLSLQLEPNDNNRPSYLLCPILQEIMRDPQMAADGYTYEAEAIKSWFDKGHDTSPMTNIKLLHCDLVPNYALRCVIQDWMAQETRSQ